MSEVNEGLREHVTRIGFDLSLSRPQIDLLVLLHHFKGAKKLTDSGLKNHPQRPPPGAPPAWRGYPNWITTTRCLRSRGLIGEFGSDGYKPTKAGNLVCALLKEAGMYQERLAALLPVEMSA